MTIDQLCDLAEAFYLAGKNGGAAKLRADVVQGLNLAALADASVELRTKESDEKTGASIRGIPIEIVR